MLGEQRGRRLTRRLSRDTDEHRVALYGSDRHERTHAEVDVARCAGRARRTNLRVELVGSPQSGACRGAARVVSRPDVAPVHVLAEPPAKQHRIALRRLRDGPVELRCEVIDPPLAQPLPGVAVELLVGIEAFDLLGISRSPDAERTDAHLHPRFDRLRALVYLLDQRVYAVPAPVVARKPATLLCICGVARRIGERNCDAVLSDLGVRIEVVVDVDAIHVVTLHDVEHYAQRLPNYRGIAWIHPLVLAIGAHELWMRDADMRARVRALCAGMPGAIRVEPRMQLEPARMRFGHSEAERIVVWLRCSAFD